jgi:thioredoxin-like negative regulator of GroEL
MQEPIFDRLKKRFDDAIFKIDATKNPEAASAFGVLAVPFIVFIDENKLVSAKAGVQPESALSQFLS